MVFNHYLRESCTASQNTPFLTNDANQTLMTFYRLKTLVMMEVSRTPINRHSVTAKVRIFIICLKFMHLV